MLGIEIHRDGEVSFGVVVVPGEVLKKRKKELNADRMLKTGNDKVS